MASILDKVQFFGEVDRKGKRKDERIASEYPAFYFPTQLDELKENVARMDKQLKLGLVPASEREYTEAELRRSKKRLEEIKNSMPRFTDKERDALAVVYKDLSGQISDAMFTRTDMKKGLVNAHEEARRMSEPIINVGDAEGMFKNMGIEPVGGKVSRNQASRAWKIIGKVLGENTNTEYLRKDYKYGTFRTERALEEMER